MELHEYYVKEIFKKAGLPVLRGGVAYTEKEALDITKKMGDGPFWIKPQVLYGYSPNTPKEGLLSPQLAKNPEEVLKISQKILGMKLKGFPNDTSAVIQRVYIESAILKKTFCRFVFRVDFDYQCFTLGIMFNDKVETFYLTDLTFSSSVKKSVLSTLRIRNKKLENKFKSLLNKAFDLFTSYGAVAIELTTILDDDNTLYVPDGRLIFDPDSLFRFPDLVKCQEVKLGHEREALAKRNAFRYMGLDGNIACLVNGIGLGWATIDLIEQNGGNVACLLDVGTEPSANAITKAIRLALAEPNVDGLLINIFGGITDSKVIAKGILNASGEIATGIPIVIRMAGKEAQEGSSLLNKSLTPFLILDKLTDAVKEIVKQVKEFK